MRFPLIFFVFFLTVMSAASQTGQAEKPYFPSQSEFTELPSFSSGEKFSDPARLSHSAHGKLIADVGFQKCERRIYSLGESKSLSIEVLTLLDMQAAYSLLTILGESGLQSGPPGDEFATSAGGIRFFHGNRWIDIRSSGVPEDLVRRIATFVSDRLGPRRQKRPALISHLPKSGYDAASLKYFPGFKSFETYAKKLPAWTDGCGRDMEIAQADYSAGGQSGRLSLMSFPTQELAEECASKLSAAAHPAIYSKNIGPLVGVLQGAIDVDAANNILNAIHYDYSVNWIYEKNAKSQKHAKSKSALGIPYSILETVVESILFVVLLAVFSIGAGIAFAVFRFRSRSRMPDSALDDEITHLRMR